MKLQENSRMSFRHGASKKPSKQLKMVNLRMKLFRLSFRNEKVTQLFLIPTSSLKKDETVTAGNASGINDGAAALVIMSKQKADELGLQPLVTIKATASAGVD